MAKKAKVEVLIEVNDQGAITKITGINQKLGGTERAVMSLGRSFAWFSAGAVAAAGAAAAAMAIVAKVTWDAAREAADYGDELIKTSQKVGIAVEALAGLKYAADLSGVDTKTFETGLKTLAKGAVDAARGTGEAKNAFRDLGVTVTDVQGRTKPLDQLLLEIADRFSTVSDGTEKAAAAQRLFGRSGLDLIPLLNQGRAGIKQLTDEAARFGLIIDADAARAAELFNDNLRRLDYLLQGAKLTIGNEVIPVFNSLFDAVVSNIDVIGVLRSGVREVTATLLASGVVIAEWAVSLAHARIAVADLEISLYRLASQNPLLPPASSRWLQEQIEQAKGAREASAAVAKLADDIRHRLDVALLDFLTGRTSVPAENAPARALDEISASAERAAQKLGLVQLPDLRAPHTLFRPEESFFRQGEAAFGIEETDREVGGLPAWMTSVGGLDPNKPPIPPGGTIGPGSILGEIAAATEPALSGINGVRSAITGLGELFAGESDGIGLYAQAMQGVGDAMFQFASGQAGLGESFKRMSVMVIATLAREAAVKGAFNLAEGFAALFLNPAKAGAHFQAAAIYFGVAAAAGIAGRAMSGGKSGVGPAGNAFNPIATTQGPMTLDLSSRTQQSMTIARLEAQIADLNGQLGRLGSQPAGVVTLAGTQQAGGSVALIRHTGSMADLGGWMHDEPVVR